MPYFGVSQHRNPWVDFPKTLCSWLRRGPHMQVLGSISSCMKLSPSGVYFFLFFDLMRFATGSPIEPIVAVNGSNDAPPVGCHVLFMVSLIKKIFFSNFFTQKCEKNSLHPMGTLNSYNFGIVEDTYKLFAPNGGFWVGQFNGVI